MKPPGSEARLRKLRLTLSAAVILFGGFMMAAPFTSFGPSLPIGLIFGGAFVAYGVLRLYLTLKN